MIYKIITAFLILSSSAYAATTVNLTVTEDQGVARTNFPVTMGFPLASDTNVDAISEVKVTDNSDVEIASDRTILSRWTSGGNVRWMLLDFDATVSASSTATYKVVYGNDVTASSYTDDVVVTTETGYYKVDAGDLEFKVSRTESFKIYDVILGATTLVDSTDTWIAAHDLNGTEYNTDNADTYSVSIEFDGTERATILCTGTFEDSSNNEHFQHETRITAFGGEDVIKIEHSVIFDEDMQDSTNEISKLYMKTPLQIGSTLNVAVGGESIETDTLGTGDDYHLIQWYHNDYDIGEDGSAAAQTGNHSEGWMDVNDGSHGVTVAVRDMWERSPHKLDVDDVTANDCILYNYFWPDEDFTTTVGEIEDLIEAGNGRTLWPTQPSTDLSFRVRQYYPGTGWVDNESNACGDALTWESVYYFHTGTHTSASPTSDNAQKIYNSEMTAWNHTNAVSTEAIEGISAVNTSDYPEFETIIEDGFDAKVGEISNYKLYGAPYYGVVFYTATYLDSIGARSLAHTRYGFAELAWDLFYRSGEKKYFNMARAATIRQMDVVFSNATVAEFTDAVGNTIEECPGAYNYDEKGYGLGSMTTGKRCNWASSGGKDIYVTSFYKNHYITGSQKAEDKAEDIVTFQIGGWVTNGDTSYNVGTRGLAGFLTTALSKYEHSNDASYLTHAYDIFNAWSPAGSGNQHYPNGFADFSNTPNWNMICNPTWSGTEVEWYNTLKNDVTHKGYEETWVKARSLIWEDNAASNFLIELDNIQALARGYELTSDGEYLKMMKFLEPLYAARDAESEGCEYIGEGIAIARWGMFTRSAMHYMKENNDLSAVALPDTPPQWKLLWEDGTDETIFYINETSDAAWDFTIQVLPTHGMYDSTTCGNVYVKIYDPDNNLVSSNSFNMDDYMIDDDRFNFNAGVCCSPWEDNLVRTYSVPSDTVYGTYKIVIDVETRSGYARPAMTVIDCDYPIKFSPDKNDYHDIIPFSRSFFFVNSDASTFTITPATWSYLRVLKPDGTPYPHGLLSPSGTVITPDAGDKGEFWSIVGTTGEPASYPIAANRIKITGDAEDYLYNRPAAGQFNLASYASEPADIEGIKVTNDRWYDTTSLLDFGNSAITLANASTDEDKAIAIFRAIQQISVIANAVPTEPNYSITEVIYPLKLMNVYGFEWCSGWSKLMVDVWRALGYKARTIYSRGHTLADLYWEDSGVLTSHIFDNSAYRNYGYIRDGARLAGITDWMFDRSLATRPYGLTDYFDASPPGPGWIHMRHRPTTDDLSDTSYDLRDGESVTFYWSNTSDPYYTPTGDDVGGTDFEHGPYTKTYGNAVWEYVPGVTTGTTTYTMTFPYIIGDLELENTSGETVTVSTDDGQSWSATLDDTQGWYSYQIKVVATGDNASFKIKTTTQHNIFSLPQLWPVYNDVTVTADDIDSTLTLQVTYQWDDEGGTNKQSVSNTESSPHTYEIRADGDAWSDISGDWIKVAAVSRVGNGNEIATQEAAPTNTVDVTPTDEFATTDIIEDGFSPYPTVKSASEYRTDISTALAAENWSNLRAALYGLMEIKDSSSETKTSIISVLEAQTDTYLSRYYALQALYLSQGADCAAELEKVINRSTDYSWVDDTFVWPTNDIWLWLSSLAGAMLADIDNATTQALADELNDLIDLAVEDGEAGYFVIRTDNDDMVFTSSEGGPQTITLTANTYTGATLATELQTQLNANDTLTGTGTITFAVSYDVDTHKFTIDAGSGHTIAYTHTNSLAGPDLGFREDVGAAQTNVSTNSVAIYRFAQLQRGWLRDIGELCQGACADEITTALTFITDPTGDSAYPAAEAIGKIGSGSSTETTALASLFTNEISDDRIKALYAMQAIGNLKGTSDSYEDYLTDWDEDFRAFSAEALGNLCEIDQESLVASARAGESFTWVEEVMGLVIDQFTYCDHQHIIVGGTPSAN